MLNDILDQKVAYASRDTSEAVISEIEKWYKDYSDPVSVTLIGGATYYVCRVPKQIFVIHNLSINQGHAYEVGSRIAVLAAIDIYNRMYFRNINRCNKLVSTIIQWLCENGGL